MAMGDPLSAGTVKWLTSETPLTYGKRLDTLCADFYILERLDADGDPVASRMFDTTTQALSTEFSFYLDMAVGGELRHAWCHGFELPDVSELAEFKSRCAANDWSRSRAWRDWVRLRRERPDVTREWLILAACLFEDEAWNDRAVGGRSWGLCARVLYDYLNHTLKARTFVDRCWTLEHNNGNVFNKVYDVSNLQRVLQTQYEGHYSKLSEYASRTVRVMYQHRIPRGTRREDYLRTKLHRDEAWLGIQDVRGERDTL